MKLTPGTMKLANLLLDPNNYRFLDEKPAPKVPERRFIEPTVQDAALKKLQSDTAFQMLKDSIGSNGFLPSEPLIVKKYDESNYVIVDGNRRVAAVKSLIAEYENGADYDERFIDSLKELPAAIATTDASGNSDYQILMGVRHLSGIKRWGGYAEARLISDLADQADSEPESIADKLGMEVAEINRRRRAYKATEQFRTHPEFGRSFKTEMYALFHEAVAIPAIRDRYGWSNTSMSFADADGAADFFALLVERTEDGNTIDPKLRTYSDVRKFGKQIAPSDDLVSQLEQPDATLDGIIANLDRDREEREWGAKIQKLLRQLNQIPAIAVSRATAEEKKLLQDVKDTIDVLLKQAGSGESS